MDTAAKKTLRGFHVQLIDELMMTETFLGIFYQSGILDDEMIEIIKKETTTKAQNSKFLQILPNRGPSAFKTLIRELKKTHTWLAPNMEKTYNRYLSKTTSLTTQDILELDSTIQTMAEEMTEVFLSNQNLKDVIKRKLQRIIADIIEADRKQRQDEQRNPDDVKSVKIFYTKMGTLLLGEDYRQGLDSAEDKQEFLKRYQPAILEKMSQLEAVVSRCLEVLGEEEKGSNITLPDIVDQLLNKLSELENELRKEKYLSKSFKEESNRIEKELQNVKRSCDALQKDNESLKIKIARFQKETMYISDNQENIRLQNDGRRNYDSRMIQGLADEIMRNKRGTAKILDKKTENESCGQGDDDLTFSRDEQIQNNAMKDAEKHQNTVSDAFDNLVPLKIRLLSREQNDKHISHSLKQGTRQNPYRPKTPISIRTLELPHAVKRNGAVTKPDLLLQRPKTSFRIQNKSSKIKSFDDFSTRPESSSQSSFKHPSIAVKRYNKKHPNQNVPLFLKTCRHQK